ncbi:IclR family transcriptional regulator [Amycolatopsis jejuensis]|uniref:IclR family transcriptional regulator n=1 Tax=Amycolatopsis jejuensis TaxID=330084 RepID=UPI000527DD38|nr:IclR family transcriptional regulator [Amycolatopsis jejuensis]
MCPAHREDGEVTAIGRAALILKQFRSGTLPVSAATVARRAGLPRATVYRMLQELVRSGLLERDGTAFRPGLLLFELGQLVPRSLQEAARRHMAVLHEATGQNVGLAVEQEGEVVHVDILRAERAPRLPLRTGGRWPAHASCSGKVMLAFGPADEVRSILGKPLKRLTAHTITDPTALEAELERVRRARVAFDRQESFPDVTGVASPIFGPDGAVLAALSISGMAGRINLSRVDAAVRTSALAITRELAMAESVVRPVLTWRG